MLDVLLWPLEAPLEVLIGLFTRFGLTAGPAIVALTVVVRLALLPLAARQARAVWILRGLSDHVGRIVEQGGDRETQRQQLMALYSRNRVAPFGPALMLIPQGLVFLGLYRVIIGDTLADEGAFGIIDSLATVVWTQPGAWAVLVIAAAAFDIGIVISSRRAGIPLSWLSRVALVFLPAGMLLSAYLMPAGLAVYLAASALFGVAQALWLARLTAGDPPILEPDPLETSPAPAG